MERVAEQSHRVSALGLALAPRPPASIEKGANAVSIADPDPEALARDERARVLQEAHAEGLASGLVEADVRIAQRAEACERQIRETHRAAQERLEGSQRQLDRLLKSIPEKIAHHEQQVEKIAAEIAFEALVRCLGAGNAERGLTIQIAEEVLRERRERPATLWVSADDFDVMQHLAGIEALKVHTDPNLGRGDLRLETPVGQYETGVAQRIQALADAFIQTMDEGR